MPDRILEAFRALPEGELSAWIERGRTLDAISRRISTMVEVKGIVGFVEVVEQVQELLEDEDFMYYLPPLMTRADLETVNFRFVTLQDPEGLYIAHETLCLEENEFGEFSTLKDPTTAEIYLMRSLRCVPFDFERYGDGLDYSQWVRSCASYRALVSYLDGRVPDGADDHAWAVDYASEMASRARATLSTKDDIELTKATDLELSAEQRAHVGKLIGDLMKDVPRWVNGGWSKNETLSLFGGLASGGGRGEGRARPKPKPKPKSKMKSVPRGQKRGRNNKKRGR